MGPLAFLLYLSLQDDPFRVDSSPFLVLGDQVDLEARNVPKDAVVVWRLADGPSASIETRPALSPSSQMVKGPSALTVIPTGKADAEFRFAVPSGKGSGWRRSRSSSGQARSFRSKSGVAASSTRRAAPGGRT